MTEDFVLELAVGGFVEISGKKHPSRASRLAILADGTTAPVLLLLGRKRYVKITREQVLYWIDGDPSNETLANVGLATRSATGRRPRSSYGAPSGTREYMKAWREKNGERVRAAQKRWRASRETSVSKPVVAPFEGDDPVLDQLRRLVGEE
jgi:hypothetical protein